jgi:predicted helicase
METAFGPGDVFHYIYAVVHSPTYRTRYAEFLKRDFPRIPLTSDRDLFRNLCALGGELVSYHLLEAPALEQVVPRFPVRGDDTVAKGYPKYVASGRVYINKDQYFDDVPPAVWQFQIGGYQVCEKWLKDRRGRTLSYDDLTHYQKVVVALQETIRLMAEIDAAIPSWPIQ